MHHLKPWYRSKTVWGAVVAVLAAVASLLGFDVDDAAQATLVDSLLQAAGAAGALFALFGRIVATDMIE